MAACRQLGFEVTGNSAIRSADPENPTLEPNMKIGSPVAEIWPFAYHIISPSPIWGEGEVIEDQRWHHSKEGWWFPISSSSIVFVTVALSVTNRPQFAIECLRRSNQQGGVTLGPNLGVFPLEQTRHVGVAKSEHPRLTNGEIISEEFQPM